MRAGSDRPVTTPVLTALYKAVRWRGPSLSVRTVTKMLDAILTTSIGMLIGTGTSHYGSDQFTADQHIVRAVVTASFGYGQLD